MPRDRSFPHSASVTEASAKAELAEAGVPENGLKGWQCTRAFNWWVVRSDAGGLPLRAAKDLHAKHSKVVLPLGQSRVNDLDDLAGPQGGIRFYHARTPEGLKAVVRAITASNRAENT